MVLRRIEHRLGEVVYIYKCEVCGYVLEVSYKKSDVWIDWYKPKKPKPYMIAW